MKHLLKTIPAAVAALLLSINVSGQWRQPSHRAADELRGLSACTTQFFESPQGGLFVYSDSNQVGIMTTESFFDYRIADFNLLKVGVIVGYYEGGKLKWKENTYFFTEYNKTNVCYSNVSTGKQIKKHLSKGGTIRIIADRYDIDQLEMTVPPDGYAIGSKKK